jgi:hypothetical protein
MLKSSLKEDMFAACFLLVSSLDSEDGDSTGLYDVIYIKIEFFKI